MSPDQYNAHFLAYIAEFQGKQCYVRPTYDHNACINYCQQVYDYVPSLPYKNAQNYNSASRLCEAKLFCPKMMGVYYNSTTRKCRDILLGKDIDPIDASPPVYNKTVTVTVICQNGVVK